jgi:hypothetical protein
MQIRYAPEKYTDVKSWVINAIIEEERLSPKPLWEKASSEGDAYRDRLRRIKFLRTNNAMNAHAGKAAERLESCRPDFRCLSGACPECGRLFQRAFVRKSRAFIRDYLETLPKQQLIALSIIPRQPIVRPGTLHQFSIINMQRRLKSALENTDVKMLLGGIDFSFNEDQAGKYSRSGARIFI